MKQVKYEITITQLEGIERFSPSARSSPTTSQANPRRDTHPTAAIFTKDNP